MFSYIFWKINSYENCWISYRISTEHMEEICTQSEYPRWNVKIKSRVPFVKINHFIYQISATGLLNYIQVIYDKKNVIRPNKHKFQFLTGRTNSVLDHVDLSGYKAFRKWGGEGSHFDSGIRVCACLSKCFFMNSKYSDWWFSSQKISKSHKLDVFLTKNLYILRL